MRPKYFQRSVALKTISLRNTVPFARRLWPPVEKARPPACEGGAVAQFLGVGWQRQNTVISGNAPPAQRTAKKNSENRAASGAPWRAGPDAAVATFQRSMNVVTMPVPR